MTEKNKILTTVLFSALAGSLLGGIIVFIAVSNYLGKYSADIAARSAANQLTRDVQVLEKLDAGQREEAIVLIKRNIRQKYTYLRSLRHDVSETTRTEVNTAITYTRNYLGDSQTLTNDAK